MSATSPEAAQALESRASRWIAAVTVLCAMLGYAAVLWTLLAQQSFEFEREVALATLVLAPFAVGPVVLRGRRAARLRAYAAALVALLQMLLVVRVFDLHDGSAIAALSVAAQGHALARVPAAGASSLSLALALAQTAAALRVEARDGVFGILLLQIACAVVALVVLQARQSRAQLSRTRRTSSVQADLDLAARLSFGLRLGAILVLPGLLLLGLVTRAGDSSWMRMQSGPSSEAEEELDPLSMADRIDDSGRDPTLWNDAGGLGEGVGRLSDEVVLTLRARVAGEDVGPRLPALWLCVLPLDTFEGSALGNPDLGGMRELVDAEDGARDGWIEVRARAGLEPMQLEVLQRGLRVSSTEGDALVRSRPLLRVQAGRVLFSPDGALVVPATRQERFAYRMTCAAPWSLEPPGPGQRARHPDPRFVQLPEASPALERIREVALAATAGASDDLERLQGVLAFLDDGFSYSLEGSGFAGIDGVVRFLEERSGYCTAYAATAVLLLRSLGVPARAVGGYLAREHDPLEEVFVVRGRDAHAWIEVHFEGLGWRTYDPTPGRARDQAFARARGGGDRGGLGAWSGELLEALRQSTLNDGPQVSLARVREVLAAAPEAVLESAMRAPWRSAATFALALMLFAWLVHRSLQRPGRASVPKEVSQALPLFGKLLEALGRLGLRPRRGETLREFALRAAQQGPEGLQGVPQAAEIFYETRFGGQELGEEQRGFVKQVLGQVRAVAAARRGRSSSISPGT